MKNSFWYIYFEIQVKMWWKGAMFQSSELDSEGVQYGSWARDVHQGSWAVLKLFFRDFTILRELCSLSKTPFKEIQKSALIVTLCECFGQVTCGSGEASRGFCSLFLSWFFSGCLLSAAFFLWLIGRIVLVGVFRHGSRWRRHAKIGIFWAYFYD